VFGVGEQRVGPMIEWKQRDAFVGVFDILGFKNLIRQTDQEFPRAKLTGQLDDLLETLDDQNVREHGQVECMVFSDTIVIFAPNLDGDSPLRSYGWFSRLCTRLITKSVEIRLPLRGAISVGTAFTSTSPPIILGPSFLDAHEYCEDQDWIGLLLTPSATEKFMKVEFNPIRIDFVSDNLIPLRKKPPANVMAYRFQNAEANFSSPLLPVLDEMRRLAPSNAKEKYSRTIDFIERHYRYLSGEPTFHC
jgi:hypothetical protein